jgi:hypothetical protein
MDWEREIAQPWLEMSNEKKARMKYLPTRSFPWATALVGLYPREPFRHHFRSSGFIVAILFAILLIVIVAYFLAQRGTGSAGDKS